MIFPNLPLNCQFNESEDSLLTVDGDNWCIYHCPIIDKDGNPTEKGAWNQEMLDNFEQKINVQLQNASHSGSSLNLTGVIFPAAVNFQTKAFPPVSFRDTTFIGNASFERVIFSGDVSFEHARFSANAHFENVRFHSRTIFEYTIFGGDAHFEHALFQMVVEFSRMSTRDAHFDYASFEGDVSFNGVTVSRNLSFGHTTFNRGFSCQHTKIGNHAGFNHAEFRGNETSFHGATFIGRAGFELAKFTNRKTEFRKATFCAKAEFGDTTFNRDVSFSHVTFSDEARFSHARFTGSTRFTNARFIKDAHFDSSGESTNEELVQANIFHDSDFTDAVFEQGVSFINRQFLQPAIFANCTFGMTPHGKAPQFYGCALHDGSVFPPRSYFYDVRSEGAANAYRKLKLAMGQHNARREEAKFYALEQESLRHQPTTPVREKLASWLYYHLADYGENFLLPLVWLVVITVGFGFFYYFATVWVLSSSVILEYRMACFQFAMEQLVRPFSAWLPTGGNPLKMLLDDNLEFLIMIQVFAIVQGLATLGLVTLFIVGLRRRFKLW